jgi:hypothetical protein
VTRSSHRVVEAASDWWLPGRRSRRVCSASSTIIARDAADDIAAWLRELERYEQAFRKNEIDAAILPKLTFGQRMG